MPSRIQEIDTLRALSVTYIVGFWHLFNYTEFFPGHYNESTLRLTIVILGLFVFLSGYLLGKRQVAHAWRGYKSFYLRRLARIYPPYLAALALFYLFELADGSTLLKAALLVSMFHGPPPLTLWFITMLMIFYVTAPFLIAVRSSPGKFALLATLIFAVFLGADLLLPSSDPRTVIYFPAFVAGLLVSRATVFSKPWLLIGSLLVLLIGSWISLSVPNRPPLSYYSVVLASAGPLVVYAGVLRAGAAISNRLISVVAYAGFMMYLIHRPIYEGMQLLFYPEMPWLQWVYLTLVCLPVIVGVSWAAQRSYDMLVSSLPFVRPAPS